MISWREFEASRQDLATAGRELLYQFGVGLAFLGTTRRDGGPRIHPIAPMLSGDGLYGFLERSLKLDDLLRDARYALHSFPTPVNEDAFYLTGQAVAIRDAALLTELREAYLKERGGPPPTLDRQTIVEFRIETCLLTRTSGHGDFAPRHEVWHADKK